MNRVGCDSDDESYVEREDLHEYMCWGRDQPTRLEAAGGSNQTTPKIQRLMSYTEMKDLRC